SPTYQRAPNLALHTKMSPRRHRLPNASLKKVISMSVESRYQPPTAAVADIAADEPPLEPLNPWFSMWTRPRATIQQIVDTDPSRFMIVLSMLIGVTQVLDRASTRSLGDRVSLGTILAVALVLGPFLGLIAVHVYAWFVRWTGR